MEVHTDLETTVWRKIWERLHAKAQTLDAGLQIQVPSYDARCYNFSAVKNAPPRAEVHLNFSAPNRCLFLSFEGDKRHSGMFRVEPTRGLVNAKNDVDSSPEVLADDVLDYLIAS
jgi:hypothetical protein